MVQFLLKCPKCGQRMKYESKSMILTGKRKRCVYCGRSFLIRKAILKRL